MGVSPGDCALNDGYEVAVDKRYASGWLGRKELPKSVDLSRVSVLYSQVAEGNGEFLVRYASVWPSVCGDIERVDDFRFGECGSSPEQG